jgi:hypothetical protein
MKRRWMPLQGYSLLCKRFTAEDAEDAEKKQGTTDFTDYTEGHREKKRFSHRGTNSKL